METVMYIGPTIMSPILLRHRGIYNGVPSRFLKTLKDEEREAIEKCFVPLGEAGAALRELEGQKEPTAYTDNYRAAERLFGGKK